MSPLEEWTKIQPQLWVGIPVQFHCYVGRLHGTPQADIADAFVTWGVPPILENIMQTYVTFGQIHTHRVNGVTLDCDSIAVINAVDAETGRARAFELFDRKFMTTYTEDQWDTNDEHYFPRGFIEVE